MTDYSVTASPPSWSRCLCFPSSSLPHTLEELYYQDYHEEDNKQEAETHETSSRYTTSGACIIAQWSRR